MKAPRTVSALVFGTWIASPLPAGAIDTQTVETKLQGSQLIAGSNFGETVDVDGDVMAIGAPDHYVPPDANGSVYIFVRIGSAWSEHSRLFASDSQLGDEFGAAVALHGETLLVGAPSRDGPSGEFEGGAYVFTRAPNGSWSEQVKLLPPGVGAPDRFGERVALAGDLAVVLSSGSSSSGHQVFPFERNGQNQWVQEPALDPPFLVQDIGLVGTTLVATGILADETAGAAVYERSGGAWVFDTVLAGGENGFFARQAFDGETLALSRVSLLAPPDVHIFQRGLQGDWIEQSLVPPAIGRQATFGAAMALSGDRLAVALLNDPTDDFDSVLLFTPDDQGVWQPALKLIPPGYPTDDGFGSALSDDGETLAIGAVEDSFSAGAVFIVQLSEAIPGEVPPSLTVSRAAGDALTLAWDPSCAAGAADYEIYEGQLGDFASHTALFCTTDGETTKTFVQSAADSYYLVVARTGAREGSYGKTSGGSERSQGASACLPQELSACR